MYQPNEPIRGKYLVSMEAKINEEIEQRKAHREQSNTHVQDKKESIIKRLQEVQFSFFGKKTDRSVSIETSKEIVAIQPNFLG